VWLGAREPLKEREPIPGRKDREPAAPLLPDNDRPKQRLAVAGRAHWQGLLLMTEWKAAGVLNVWMWFSFLVMTLLPHTDDSQLLRPAKL
jgi:hypothetical protein